MSLTIEDRSRPAAKIAARVAWAGLFAASLAAAIVLAGPGTWQLWVFFVAPDVAIVGLAAKALEPGQMHPRAVPTYNALHALPGPLVLLALTVALGATPWIAGALGLLAHIAMDRAAGYTLRTPDGRLRG